MSDGIITTEERYWLEEQRVNIGVSSEDALSILKDVQNLSRNNVMSMGTVQRVQLNNFRSAVEGKKRIYIIRDCEKMRIEAANSMLKFLEEPEENIIAILVTKNIYQLLTTIVSRCQIISLKKNKEKETIDEEVKEKLEYVNNFIKYLEKEKIETLLMTQKLWHEYFKERKDYINGYELILIYYKDVLNFKLNRQIELFSEYKEEIEVIANNNTFNNLIYKINKIIELKEHIKVNANQSLLLDKLIIELSRGDIDG